MSLLVKVLLGIILLSCGKSKEKEVIQVFADATNQGLEQTINEILEQKIDSPSRVTKLDLLDSGKDIGNGGIGVVCTDKDGNETVEFLDLMKARVFWNMKVATIEGDNEIEMAKNVISKIREVDPQRYLKYKKDIENFYSESKILRDYVLGSTNDFRVHGEFKNCRYQNIISQLDLSGNEFDQNDLNYREDARYLIDGNLFDMLTTQDKAALIIHEVIYKEAILVGHEKSHHVTYFNAYLHSEKFQSAGEGNTNFFKQSQFDYFKLKVYFGVLAKTNLPYEQFGVLNKVRATGTSFDHLFTRVLIARPYETNHFIIPQVEWRYTTHSNQGDRINAYQFIKIKEGDISAIDNIFYHHNRTIGLLVLNRSIEAKIIGFDGGTIRLPEIVEFHPNGMIKYYEQPVVKKDGSLRKRSTRIQVERNGKELLLPWYRKIKRTWKKPPSVSEWSEYSANLFKGSELEQGFVADYKNLIRSLLEFGESYGHFYQRAVLKND